MKKQIIYLYIASLLGVAACEDFNEANFDGLDDMKQPTNILNIDYSLTAEDYTTFDKKSSPYVNKYFDSELNADTLFPSWLAKRYSTADPTSVVKLTFNQLNKPSDLLSAYWDIPCVTLEKNTDYVPTFYPEGAYAPFLNSTTESQIIDKLVKVKYANPKKGDYVMVGYNYNETAQAQMVATPIFNYDFEADETVEVLEKLGNWYVATTGDNKWKLTSYSGNKYIQYTANKASGPCEAWMITPSVKIEGTDKKIAFDVAVGYWDAHCLSVFVATDFDEKKPEAATWIDITSNFTFPEQTNGYSKLATAGTASLSEFAGKNIRIAFKYAGDGTAKKTTTYQIDNVVVGKDIPKMVAVTARLKLFQCTKDGAWSEFLNKKASKVFCLTNEDYLAMGTPGKTLSFSSSIKQEDYIPAYLANHAEEFGLQYAQDGDARVVIYRYSGKAMEAQAKEYIYSAANAMWMYNNRVEPKTRQYAFNGEIWLFDPSVTLLLKADKSDKETAAFYQSITDWVKENKGAEYVTSFGNNDYYYGGSAYNNNFDFRLSAWRAQNSEAYAALGDDELKSLMDSRLPEAFLPGLEKKYPNAELVEGVVVVYTVNFSVYDGTETKVRTIKYKVVEKGKFEYIEDSLE